MALLFKISSWILEISKRVTYRLFLKNIITIWLVVSEKKIVEIVDTRRRTTDDGHSKHHKSSPWARKPGRLILHDALLSQNHSTMKNTPSRHTQRVKKRRASIRNSGARIPGQCFFTKIWGNVVMGVKPHAEVHKILQIRKSAVCSIIIEQTNVVYTNQIARRGNNSSSSYKLNSKMISALGPVLLFYETRCSMR